MSTTIQVECLPRDGPSRPGDRYVPDSDERRQGTVRQVLPTGPNHVLLTVKLDEAA